MSKNIKLWLIIAAILMLLGSIVFVGAMSMIKWDFKKLGTSSFETNTHELNEDFHNIRLKSNTADILFVPSENGECKVVCYEETDAKHSVSVQDGTLTICVDNQKKWFQYIGIHTGTPKITLYLPKTEYGTLNIENSTGAVVIPKNFQFEAMDISVTTGTVKNYASVTGSVNISSTTGAVTVESISAGALEISVTTGNVKASGISCQGDVSVNVSTGRTELMDISCKRVVSTGNTGDITLRNVLAEEKFAIERSTGDVKFTNSDAAEIFVKTDTGDVSGSLLTEKVFIIETDTGDIDVPKSINGGKCEIITDTGDIEITINQKT